MKRVSIFVLLFVLVFGLSLSGLAFAGEAKKPNATLNLEEGQVAAGIGWNWGKGDLNMNGKAYPFKVKGLSVGDVGISEAKAEGNVYNLKNIDDFDGIYAAASAEATMVEGAGATVMKNDKGVEIHLMPKTKGANLKLAAEGVELTLER